MALRLFALLAAALVAAIAIAQADELQEISRLLRQGQHGQALARVDQFLSTRPRDAQGRFLKGLILVEQNKTAEAIETFNRLSQDYPELPEPYNNLAVLYAAQGQYEKARQALEMSIRTHPSYATAYENLGDVYTKLASQAYDKALQLDSSNSTAQSKLSLVRDLISAANKPSRAGAGKVPEPSKPTVVAAAPKAAPPAPAADSKAAAPAKAPEKAAEKATSARSSPDDVIRAAKAWAEAWSRKDVDGYLAAYAPDFKTPGGEPRAAWEKTRRQRITAPKQIDVELEAVKVTAIAADRATVSFKQHYRSDTLKVDGAKTLVMVRVGGRWLIQQERVGN